jgi:hypothetical protein
MKKQGYSHQKSRTDRAQSDLFGYLRFGGRDPRNLAETARSTSPNRAPRVERSAHFDLAG